MKKRFGIAWLVLIISIGFAVSASAKEKTLLYSKDGYGSSFKKDTYVYYRVNVSITDYLTVYGVYGFASESKYYSFLETCKNSYCDTTSSKYYNRRYEYTLCNSKFKSIDPAGWHKPGKSNYRYGYFLKPGTYYIRIKTNKKSCGYYNIRSFLISSMTGAGSKAYVNGGGSTKKKAVTIKNPDSMGFQSHAKLLYYPWHGNYFAFPLMKSGKNAETWFKYYSDGSVPFYVVTRLGHVSGKWDITVYGPSYPKGWTRHLPDKSITDANGSNHFYKDGEKSPWGNTINLERSNSYTTIGPRPGWYYFKITKRKSAGKKDDYYKKMSICGDIFITTQTSLLPTDIEI